MYTVHIVEEDLVFSCFKIDINHDDNIYYEKEITVNVDSEEKYLYFLNIKKKNIAIPRIVILTIGNQKMYLLKNVHINTIYNINEFDDYSVVLSIGDYNEFDYQCDDYTLYTRILKLDKIRLKLNGKTH
jgi:hypothetical protein